MTATTTSCLPATPSISVPVDFVLRRIRGLEHGSRLNSSTAPGRAPSSSPRPPQARQGGDGRRRTSPTPLLSVDADVFSLCFPVSSPSFPLLARSSNGDARWGRRGGVLHLGFGGMERDVQ
jgi:hypothetical protein